MARLPRPSRAARPSSRRGSSPRQQQRSSSTRRRSRRGKGAIGAIAGGLLGVLGSLFGGRGGGSSSSTRLDAAPGMSAATRGGGKANYGPLPSFTIQSKTARRYGNPTLATISLQMTDVLKAMGLIRDSLESQFKHQQFVYNENARVQREINAESKGEGFVPFIPGDGSQLGVLSIKQLNDTFMRFSKALDDAAEALNNMDCSCDGGDIDIPFLPGSKGRGAGTRAAATAARRASLIAAGKSTRFVSPKDALNKKGLVKPGYEPVFNKKTGAVAGYRKMSGWGGEWARRSGFFSERLGRTAEKISGGINAVGRAAKKYAITPAANLINRSSQMIKGMFTRGATSVSQSPFTRSASKLIKGGISIAKRAGSAIKSGAKAVGRFALRKGLTIAFIAYESWNAYQEIKALPSELTPRQRKSAIAKIIGRLVASIGLIWAGAAIGTLLGTAVPGPGWLVGFLGGLIGGIAADLIFGNSVDELVNLVIDTLYPTDKEIAKKVPEAKKEVPVPAPMAASAQGEGAVPYKKPAASVAKASVDLSLKAARKETVGALIDDTAARVGVDASLMTMVASENTAFNPKKQVQSVNGPEIFKLTPQQWSYITSQYGPRYPELYAGINDPKAATTAGALLIKDSQEFLTKNNIEVSPLSMYGSYLFGYEGIRDLLNSQPSDVASRVLPEAAQARPELFKDASGEITTNTLVQRLYNRTLPEKQKRSAPQGVPAIPPSSTPKIDGLKPPSGANDKTNTGTPGPSGSTGTPRLAGAAGADGSMGKDGDATYSSPTHTATQTVPKSGKEPAAEMVQSVPTDRAAQPVPPAPSTGPGAMVDEKTKELEQAAKDAQAIADNPIVMAAMGGKNAPAVLPSSRPGYTGTGNVPDPYYIFMDQYEYQFRFKSSPVLATAQTSWT